MIFVWMKLYIWKQNIILSQKIELWTQLKFSSILFDLSKLPLTNITSKDSFQYGIKVHYMDGGQASEL